MPTSSAPASAALLQARLSLAGVVFVDVALKGTVLDLEGVRFLCAMIKSQSGLLAMPLFAEPEGDDAGEVGGGMARRTLPTGVRALTPLARATSTVRLVNDAMQEAGLGGTAEAAATTTMALDDAPAEWMHTLGDALLAATLGASGWMRLPLGWARASASTSGAFEGAVDVCQLEPTLSAAGADGAFLLRVCISGYAVHRAIPVPPIVTEGDRCLLLPTLEHVVVHAVHDNCPPPPALQQRNAALGYDLHLPATREEHARWWRGLHGIAVPTAGQWLSVSRAADTTDHDAPRGDGPAASAVHSCCVLQTWSEPLRRHARDDRLRAELQERVNSDLTKQLLAVGDLLPSSKFAVTSCTVDALDSRGAVQAPAVCSSGDGDSECGSCTQWASGLELLNHSTASSSEPKTCAADGGAAAAAAAAAATFNTSVVTATEGGTNAAGAKAVVLQKRPAASAATSTGTLHKKKPKIKKRRTRA